MKTEIALAKMPNKIKYALIVIGIYLFSELFKSLIYPIITEENISYVKKIVTVLKVLFIGFLAFKIKERKNWAKIVLLVIFIVHAIGLALSIIAEFLFKFTFSILTVVQFLIVTTILIFLFGKESELWYTASKIGRESNTRLSFPKEAIDKNWFWLIIPLCFLGFTFGCNMNTGGNFFAGMIILFGPFIFGLILIILITLLLVGQKKENQSLILVSKIGLLFVSFPMSYTVGVIFCN